MTKNIKLDSIEKILVTPLTRESIYLHLWWLHES